MNLELKRIAQKPTHTIGRLYIDGVYFCDTLEDPVRAPGIKIAGQTAIPAGTYIVKNTISPRFRRELPRLYDVPGFDGILIHRGNTPADTSGCILVGENTQVGKVLNSTKYEQELVRRLLGITNAKITIS